LGLVSHDSWVRCAGDNFHYITHIYLEEHKFENLGSNGWERAHLSIKHGTNVILREYVTWEVKKDVKLTHSHVSPNLTLFGEHKGPKPGKYGWYIKRCHLRILPTYFVRAGQLRGGWGGKFFKILKKSGVLLLLLTAANFSCLIRFYHNHISRLSWMKSGETWKIYLWIKSTIYRHYLDCCFLSPH